MAVTASGDIFIGRRGDGSPIIVVGDIPGLQWDRRNAALPMMRNATQFLGDAYGFDGDVTIRELLLEQLDPDYTFTVYTDGATVRKPQAPTGPDVDAALAAVPERLRLLLQTV